MVDSAFTTAVAVEDLLDALGRRAGGASGGVEVATTGSVGAFERVRHSLFGAGLPPVASVELATPTPVTADPG